jgi:hypothetical protein
LEDREPYLRSLTSIGGRTVPHESNFRVNPAHPAFSDLVIGKPEDLSFDPRLASSFGPQKASQLLKDTILGISDSLLHSPTPSISPPELMKSPLAKGHSLLFNASLPFPCLPLI